MFGPRRNYNAHASSSTAIYPTRKATTNESTSSSNRKPEKSTFEESDPSLPPPHQKKEKHQIHRNSYAPILKQSNDVVANSRTSSSNFITKSGVLKDDDETDDDEDAGKAGVTRPVEIEDVCLICVGKCSCGGRYNSPGPSLKITLSQSAKPTSSFNKPRASHATATPKYVNSPPLLPFIVLDDDEEEDFRPAKRARPLLKKSTTKRAIAAGGSEVVTKYKKKHKIKKDKNDDSAAFSSGGSSTHRTHLPKSIQVTTTNSSDTPRKISLRPLPTPSRSSLRQVLAASVREVTVSRENTPTISLHEEKPFSYDADKDDDPLTELESDGDSDSGMEKAEEKALREEFEKGEGFSGIGTTGAESSDDDLTEESSESDRDDGWEERKREREEDRKRTSGGGDSTFLEILPNLHSHREGSLAYDESMEMEEEYHQEPFKVDTTFTELPETGGRGVVTWSDYDSVDHSEDEDDEGGEFEDELEELLALSEAVVGPVREDEYELGEMWFEEISNQGDDESGSAEEDNTIEDQLEETVIIQGWGKSSTGSNSDSDDTDDMEGYQYYDEDDGGDTTDSLDSDDHVGLIRFGIEVGSDDSDDSFEEPSYFNVHAPGTASMADVYAPSTADLASLPNYFFSKPVQDDDVEEYSLDSITVPIPIEMIPKILPVAVVPIELPKSLNKGKGRAVIKGGPPTMGSFMPKEVGRGSDLSVVIDSSDKIAASPFSKIKKSKKRSRDLLETVTPSRRARADSKVSTASGGRSVTDGSISGEALEVFSPPIFEPEIVHLDLDDLLHPSVLGQGNKMTSTSSDDNETEGEIDSQKIQGGGNSGLNDLSRWNRVPIGSFRTSTMPTFFPGSQYLSATTSTTSLKNDYSGRRLSVGEHLRIDGSLGSTISHTLSPRLSEPLSHKAKRHQRKSLNSSKFSSPTSNSNSISTSLYSPISHHAEGGSSTAAFLNAIASPLFTSTIPTTMNSIVPPFLLD